MAIIQTTIYECDRCGARTSDNDSGHRKVRLTVGTALGNNPEHHDSLFCVSCVEDITRHMKPIPEQGEPTCQS